MLTAPTSISQPKGAYRALKDVVLARTALNVLPAVQAIQRWGSSARKFAAMVFDSHCPATTATLPMGMVVLAIVRWNLATPALAVLPLQRTYAPTSDPNEL